MHYMCNVTALYIYIQMKSIPLIVLIQLSIATSILPPKFQWKFLDYAWKCEDRKKALAEGNYIPQNNMPTGIARWRNKLFVTVPRWKPGVPSSLNYIYIDGEQTQPLNPYPSWREGFVEAKACCISTNSTVVSTFRIHVDGFNRLWVVDNGVIDMASKPKQIAEPAVLVFDLVNNTLLKRFAFPEDVLKDTSVLTSIVVEIVPNIDGKCTCESHAYAYITDMGSNAIIVYSYQDGEAWRVEHPFFGVDYKAGVYRVGGIDFFWNDGVSAAALSVLNSTTGYRDLFFHPTSSTKQFKMSTSLLRKDAPSEDVFAGVQVVGDRGPYSQATACAYDPMTNVLFFTQLSKNGIGCWNTLKPFTRENAPVIMNDCNMLEFPNDIKVDHEGNLWVLSDRQARFLYDHMDFQEINFRILSAPVTSMIWGTPCDKEAPKPENLENKEAKESKENEGIRERKSI